MALQIAMPISPTLLNYLLDNPRFSMNYTLRKLKQVSHDYVLKAGQQNTSRLQERDFDLNYAVVRKMGTLLMLEYGR